MRQKPALAKWGVVDWGKAGKDTQGVQCTETSWEWDDLARWRQTPTTNDGGCFMVEDRD